MLSDFYSSRYYLLTKIVFISQNMFLHVVNYNSAMPLIKSFF